MPDESDVRERIESTGRGPSGRKVRLWAICHVGGVTPAVKIFDTSTGSGRDISGGSTRGIVLRSTSCIVTGGCK